MDALLVAQKRQCTSSFPSMLAPSAPFLPFTFSSSLSGGGAGVPGVRTGRGQDQPHAGGSTTSIHTRCPPLSLRRLSSSSLRDEPITNTSTARNTYVEGFTGGFNELMSSFTSSSPSPNAPFSFSSLPHDHADSPGAHSDSFFSVRDNSDCFSDYVSLPPFSRSSSLLSSADIIIHNEPQAKERGRLHDRRPPASASVISTRSDASLHLSSSHTPTCRHFALGSPDSVRGRRRRSRRLEIDTARDPQSAQVPMSESMLLCIGSRLLMSGFMAMLRRVIGRSNVFRTGGESSSTARGCGGKQTVREFLAHFFAHGCFVADHSAFGLSAARYRIGRSAGGYSAGALTRDGSGDPHVCLHWGGWVSKQGRWCSARWAERWVAVVTVMTDQYEGYCRLTRDNRRRKKKNSYTSRKEYDQRRSHTSGKPQRTTGTTSGYIGGTKGGSDGYHVVLLSYKDDQQQLLRLRQGMRLGSEGDQWILQTTITEATVIKRKPLLQQEGDHQLCLVCEGIDAYGWNRIVRLKALPELHGKDTPSSSMLVNLAYTVQSLLMELESFNCGRHAVGTSLFPPFPPPSYTVSPGRSMRGEEEQGWVIVPSLGGRACHTVGSTPQGVLAPVGSAVRCTLGSNTLSAASRRYVALSSNNSLHAHTKRVKKTKDKGGRVIRRSGKKETTMVTAQATSEEARPPPTPTLSSRRSLFFNDNGNSGIQECAIAWIQAFYAGNRASTVNALSASLSFSPNSSASTLVRPLAGPFAMKGAVKLDPPTSNSSPLRQYPPLGSRVTGSSRARRLNITDSPIQCGRSHSCTTPGGDYLWKRWPAIDTCGDTTTTSGFHDDISVSAQGERKQPQFLDENHLREQKSSAPPTVKILGTGTSVVGNDSRSWAADMIPTPNAFLSTSPYQQYLWYICAYTLENGPRHGIQYKETHLS